MFENLIDILTEFLGQTKSSYYTDGQIQFDCPCCAQTKGIYNGGDGKYNLEVNVRKGKYNCWVCGETHGTRGKITNLIKKWGTAEIYKEYQDEKYRIYQQLLYTLRNREELDEWLVDFEDFELPTNFFSLSESKHRDSYWGKKALEYLYKRNIKDDIIEQYNIGFTDNSEKMKFVNNKRIIIPSYSKFDNLNYWVGRDFTGTNKFKYNNPQVDKMGVIFNEKHIDWDSPVNIVEGPFDHIVVPNSIPLLGKAISHDSILYDTLLNKTNNNVNIFLDGDAQKTVEHIYSTLAVGDLRDRLFYIPVKGDWDPSLIYQQYGPKGICKMLRKAEHIDEYKLIKNRLNGN